jgi:hypothetical protein
MEEVPAMLNHDRVAVGNVDDGVQAIQECGVYGSIYSHADLASTDTGEGDGRGA